MKKLIFSLLAIIFCIIANAQSYSLYLEGSVSQNGNNVLSLMLTNSEPLMGIQGSIHFPDGIVPTGITSTCDVDASGEYVDGVYSFVFLSFVDAQIPASPTPVKIGTISITTSNLEVGTSKATIDEMFFSRYPDAEGIGDITEQDSYINVQKTAVIEPQDPNYAFEIIPFSINRGETKYIPLNLKSNGSDVCYFSCKVTYPSGITNAYTSGRGGAKVMTKATIDSKNLYTTVSPDEAAEWGVSPMTFSQIIATDGSNAIYTVNSETNATYDTFVDTEDYKTIINIPVMADKDLTDGIYTLKISDISITTFDGTNPSTEYEGGEYLATVIVGQPSAQEAILYGNYNEATASVLTTALKNVAIADVTAATVDDGVKFEDVLVNKKGGYSYYTRTSANYGTTVLPFDLTTDNVDKLYTVESMDKNSIVLTEALHVESNTPCIFKGIINVKGLTPTLGDPSEQNLGQTKFKGTYQSMYLGAGDGYYISSNGKFYNDGATVRPFRGYFDGAIAGAKALQVLLEDETGIKDITDQFSTEEIYNLMGVKMNNANKGVNIINGKKVYIK